MTGSDLWTFDRMHGEPFSSGLIFITKSNCICLDPRWGAFCDPELMNMPFDREVDLGIDGEFLTGINGLVGNSPLFRLRFYHNDQVLVIDDWKQTVHRETDTSGLTDACEIFLPNNYGI
ncbi:MAG: hypothetical protein J6K46_00040 [Sutterella sp.]|nr:hypothetical protein [Sutterella sp.]